MAKKRQYSIYDAFETEKDAREASDVLNLYAETRMVKRITPQGGDGGRLKWGLFTAGKRKG